MSGKPVDAIHPELDDPDAAALRARRATEAEASDQDRQQLLLIGAGPVGQLPVDPPQEPVAPAAPNVPSAVSTTTGPSGGATALLPLLGQLLQCGFGGAVAHYSGS